MDIVSLFSGAGGLELGIDTSSNHVIWANDIDPDAVATYRTNINSHIILGDIQSIDIDEMPSADVIVGGFPCQGFSMANMKRNVEDERNVLYKFFHKAIKEKTPPILYSGKREGNIKFGQGKCR